MVSRWARIHVVLKVEVKVKGHVIGAVLCWHEKRFLSQANRRIATKVTHDGPQVCLHPECAQGQGQGQISRARDSFVLARKTLLLRGKWPDCDHDAHDGLQVSVHIGCAQFQGQGQRSRDTGTFVLDLKSLFLAGKCLDCDQTCTRWSTGEPASRVCSRSRSRSRDRALLSST